MFVVQYGGLILIGLIPTENDHKFGAEDLAFAEEVIWRNIPIKQCVILLHPIDCTICTISVVHGTYMRLSWMKSLYAFKHMLEDSNTFCSIRGHA